MSKIKTPNKITSKVNESSPIIKTYTTIGILILFYLLLTFGSSQITKKIDKQLNDNSYIVAQKDCDTKTIILSKAPSGLGLSTVKRLPLGRYSISESIVSKDTNYIYTLLSSTDRKTFILAGTNKDGKLSEIDFKYQDADSNSISTTKIPSEEYFILDIELLGKLENVNLKYKDGNTQNLIINEK